MGNGMPDQTPMCEPIWGKTWEALQCEYCIVPLSLITEKQCLVWRGSGGEAGVSVWKQCPIVMCDAWPPLPTLSTFLLPSSWRPLWPSTPLMPSVMWASFLCMCHSVTVDNYCLWSSLALEAWDLLVWPRHCVGDDITILMMIFSVTRLLWKRVNPLCVVLYLSDVCWGKDLPKPIPSCSVSQWQIPFTCIRDWPWLLTSNFMKPHLYPIGGGLMSSPQAPRWHIVCVVCVCIVGKPSAFYTCGNYVGNCDDDHIPQPQSLERCPAGCALWPSPCPWALFPSLPLWDSFLENYYHRVAPLYSPGYDDVRHWLTFDLPYTTFVPIVVIPLCHYVEILQTLFSWCDQAVSSMLTWGWSMTLDLYLHSTYCQNLWPPITQELLPSLTPVVVPITTTPCACGRHSGDIPVCLVTACSGKPCLDPLEWWHQFVYLFCDDC